MIVYNIHTGEEIFEGTPAECDDFITTCGLDSLSLDVKTNQL